MKNKTIDAPLYSEVEEITLEKAPSSHVLREMLKFEIERQRLLGKRLDFGMNYVALPDPTYMISMIAYLSTTSPLFI